MQVRVAVFVDEQGFCDEFDETDKTAAHLLMLDGDLPIATCRVFRREDTDTYIVGRLAVLKDYRGKGLGAMMLGEAQEYVKSVGGRYLSLHSQCRAQDFYAKCDFIPHGDIEYEDDCPHIWMTKALTPHTIHEMKLNAQPFELIKSGKKTFELRLYDKKRRGIRCGDLIRFTHAENTQSRLLCRVVGIHTFPSFEELYAALPLDRCGYTDNDIATAHPSDMEEYYSPEMQRTHGVVGIEIELF